MMSRKFTTREKILLLVLGLLIVGAAYYLLVQGTVADALASAKTEYEDVQLQVQVEEARAARLATMRAELESITADGSAVSEIAPYDNVQNVMRQLNTVLAQTTSYDLSFAALQTDDSGLVRRGVSMNYTCATFAAARQIMQSLHDSEYRCQISDVVVSAGDSGNVESGAVSVSLTVTYFESMN